MHRPEGHSTIISCLENFNCPPAGVPASYLPHLSQMISGLTASIHEALGWLPFVPGQSACCLTTPSWPFTILPWLTSPDIRFQPERRRLSKLCLTCGPLHVLFAPPASSPPLSPPFKLASPPFISKCQLVPHLFWELMPDLIPHQASTRSALPLFALS